MRDILIEFLKTLFNQQQQITNDIANFIAGLTGEEPINAQEAEMLWGQHTQFRWKTDRFTSEDGLLRLSYSSDHPEVAEAFLNAKIIVNGGEKTYRDYLEQCQTVSNSQSNKKEEENLKYITKRTDGRWCARKTINGKRICVYGKTQIEARDNLRAFTEKKIKEPKREPLGKFAVWWLETYKKGNVTEGTYKNYAWTITAHLSKVTTPINKVTTVQLQELLNKLPASRIRKEVYKLIRQIFKKAFELDFIKKDASEFLTVGKVAAKTREALTLDEQRRLIAALGDDMFSRRVIFYLCTGARPSEIATVRKEELRIGWVKINGTKTKGAVRWVKISERISNMLIGESPEFFNFDNKRFRQRLQRFCETNKICENIDVYTLRHTFATNLYILRVPEKDRQIYMGHAAGSAMTNAVYTTFSPDATAQDIYDIYGDLYPKF